MEEQENNQKISKLDLQPESRIVKMIFDVDISKYQKDLEKNLGGFGEPLPSSDQQEKLIVQILEHSVQNKRGFYESFKDLVANNSISLTRDLLNVGKIPQDTINIKVIKNNTVQQYSLMVESYNTTSEGVGREILEIFDFYNSQKTHKYNGNTLAPYELVQAFVDNKHYSNYGVEGSIIILADYPYYIIKTKNRRRIIWKYKTLLENSDLLNKTPILVLTIKDM